MRPELEIFQRLSSSYFSEDFHKEPRTLFGEEIFPKKSGKFRFFLQVPGAGVGPGQHVALCRHGVPPL